LPNELVSSGVSIVTKRVLDVGNCSLDHGAIRSLLEGTFQATVVQAHNAAHTADLLAQQAYDLVLVNRHLDEDGTEGLDIIRAIKADPKTSAIPCMLITNYDEHQQAAVAEGAEPGFGKKSLREAATHERLRKHLE
jgi:two-component system chemotaxis response regulator CheY